jgi:hypothetical protein
MLKRIYALLCMGAVLVPQAQAADAVATASLRVVSALSIVSTSDLRFGNSGQGSPTSTIAPDPGSSSSANFTVSGEPGAAFTITLPTDSEVQLSPLSGVGSPLSVTRFTSYPHGASSLSGLGEAQVSVGATRAEIPSTQETGQYEGQFTISVVY